MIKKILFPSIAAIIGIALISGFYNSSDQQYSERINKNNAAEPNIMEWAQVDVNTGEYNPMSRIDAMSMMKKRASRTGSIGLEFAMRGPDNVGGRTRAIIELIGKPDTLYSGGVSGGLWVSYNGGGNWQPHSQFNNLDSSSAMISSIHQDTISKKIYVGTGCSFDAFANTARVPWPGFGIYVSEDEGVTFRHLTSTTPGNRFTESGESWIAVNRIRTTADGKIYAATERGLQYSEDGGVTWENPVFNDINNPNTAVNDKCADVAVLKDGKVIVSYYGGRVFVKEDATSDFVYANLDRGLQTSGTRTCIAISPRDENYVYIMFIDGSACLSAIYRSTNGGASFTKLLEPHDDFQPMRQGGSTSGCQGVYDAAIGVSAQDPNVLYIGGITIWRYDGSLTRIASEGGSPPFQDILPFYVHADKHYFYNSPNDSRRLYVTTDGGISMTMNRGTSWQGLNKGFITTQFYGVSHFNGGGIVIGGAQDNGTLAVLGDNENDGLIGYQVFGNDGILSDASQYFPIAFASSQNGLVVRTDLSAGTETQPPFSFFSDMNSGGPFHTVVRLWENNNDLSSKDSVVFSLERTEIAVATGNGIIRNFNESFSPLQASAKVIQNSVEVRSSGQTLSIDPANPGSLIGDGEGTVTFNGDNSIDISVTFDVAPTENSNVFVSYDERFTANSIIVLESDNLNSLQGAYTFEHRLENDLNPGDAIKVQDPVQSYLFSTGAATAGGEIRFYRNVLNSQETAPPAIGIAGISGSPTFVEISKDGNVAFVGNSSGTLRRITGLNDVYTQEDADTKLTVETILNLGAGGITGINLDPNDNNRMIVSAGGYGGSNRVQYSENALSATPTFKNVHGDLAPMPIYACQFNLNDPNMVLLGTEFGIWATEDITATSVTWSDENNDASYVPTYALKQQQLSREVASNSGVVYVGTHGRGFWQSTSEKLVGTPEFGDVPSSEKFVSDFKIYPNPIQAEGKISFEAANTDQVTIVIYDINGRQVKSWTERSRSGQNTISFNTQSMKSGSYFATITSVGNRETAKFLVIK